VDEAVLRRIVTGAGGKWSLVYGNRGKQRLKSGIDGFNRAAERVPWVVLVDLDDDFDCAPPLVQAWLPEPGPLMCFRVAVRAVEAWLLADRARMAAFLGVSEALVPMDPEALPDPKGAIVGLARRSRRRQVREDLVPRPASGRRVGPAYTARLIGFAQDPDDGWRPEVAAGAADSLARAMRRIGLLGTRTLR